MNFFLTITIVSGLILVFVILKDAILDFFKKQEPQKDHENIEINEYEGIVFSSCLLTNNEKEHYHRLIKILPKNVMIHTQISFNSFLKCDFIDIRNKYNRAVVDIIISDLDFNVLAIIEVDDSSHSSARVKAKDRIRDKITSGAGISTIRINDSTTDRELMRKLKPLLPKK